MLSGITLQEYEAFKLFLEQACGIVLGDGKQYLVSSRLTKLLKAEGIGSLSELMTLLSSRQLSSANLRESVIDAMTTNETSWFRDTAPFACLDKAVFPELAERGNRRYRIWSSACSSGQEPYTISITLSEYLGSMTNKKIDLEITATDISTAILEEAKKAEYEESVLGRGLSAERKNKFFIEKPDGLRQVANEVKHRIRFKEQNLLESYASLGKFDIIFCRNVLIYFSAERKSDILNRMAQSLNSGGYLFLGASETITGYSDAFEMTRSPQGVFYRLKS